MSLKLKIKYFSSSSSRNGYKELFLGVGDRHKEEVNLIIAIATR